MSATINWSLAISYFLHALATITWLGGLLLMVIVVWPSARTRLESQVADGALLTFLDQMRKRFTPLANLSLIVLIVTGLIQMEVNPHYDGLLQLNSDWARAIFAKHVIILAMMGAAAWMQWRITPALERAALFVQRGKDAPELPLLQRREQQLVTLNLILGVIVLFFTALAISV